MVYGFDQPLYALDARCRHASEAGVIVAQPGSSPATSLNSLAELYHDQGRYGEAEPLLQRALAIFEQSLGLEHPYVATVLKNLAILLRKTDRVDEAAPLESRAQAIRSQHSGEKKP